MTHSDFDATTASPRPSATPIPPSPSTPPDAFAARRADRIALAFAGAWTAAALFVALALRPIEYGCEYDAYHVMAERLLAGEWPRDVYRPALYVLLSAGLGLGLGNCFLAAKIVSALAAGASVLLVHRLGAATFGRGVGLVACALFALNPVLMQWGVSAASDALFTFGFTWCLLAIVRHLAAPTARTAAWLGLAYAFAWFARYPALALLPTAVFALLCAAPGAARIRHTLVGAAAAAVGLVPHMAVSWLQFGKPFHDENWRNLALRHHGRENDWDYLYDNPFHDTWSVLAHDPAHVARNALEEFAAIAQRGLAEMLFREVPAGWRQALLLLTLVGALAALLRRPRQAFPLALATVTYVGLVSLTFYGLNRILLPVLPACSLALGYALLAPGAWIRRGAARAPAWLHSAVALAPAVVALWVVASCSAGRFAQFLRDQHHQLVAVAREITLANGRRPVILSNFVFLERHAACERESLNLDADPEVTWSRVLEKLGRRPIDFVAVSRVDQPWMFDALLAAPTPPFAQLVRREVDVAVFAVRADRYLAVEGVLLADSAVGVAEASFGDAGAAALRRVRFAIDGAERTALVDPMQLRKAAAGDATQRLDVVVDRDDPTRLWVPAADSHRPEATSTTMARALFGGALLAATLLALAATAWRRLRSSN